MSKSCAIETGLEQNAKKSEMVQKMYDFSMVYMTFFLNIFVIFLN